MLSQVLLRAEEVSGYGAVGVARECQVQPTSVEPASARPPDSDLQDHQTELAARGLPLLPPSQPCPHRLPQAAPGTRGRHRHDSRRLLADQRGHQAVQAG